MWLFSVVTLLAILKLLAQLDVVDVGGISAMSWWWVLGLLGVNAAWWAYADHSGLTSRKAMEAMDKRKQERIDRQRDLMGQPRKRR